MLWYNNLQIPRYLLTTVAVEEPVSLLDRLFAFIHVLACTVANIGLLMAPYVPSAQTVTIFVVFVAVTAGLYVLEEHFHPTEQKCFEPVWDAKHRCEIYRLLDDIQKVFDCVGVRQYACFGTLLGAVRHGDLIPWDDDVDIAYVDLDEDKLPRVFSELAERFNISCIVVREGLVGAPYYRLFRNSSEVIPFGQGRWPYVDVFKSNTFYNNDVTKSFISPPGRGAFDSKSVLPLRKVRFGPIYVNTPRQPFAHLDSEFGKSQGPKGYMHTAVGTSFHHRTQLPSLCSSMSKYLRLNKK